MGPILRRAHIKDEVPPTFHQTWWDYKIKRKRKKEKKWNEMKSSAPALWIKWGPLLSEVPLLGRSVRWDNLIDFFYSSCILSKLRAVVDLDQRLQFLRGWREAPLRLKSSWLWLAIVRVRPVLTRTTEKASTWDYFMGGGPFDVKSRFFWS